jgi:hypothetical protein
MNLTVSPVRKGVLSDTMLHLQRSGHLSQRRVSTTCQVAVKRPLQPDNCPTTNSAPQLCTLSSNPYSKCAPLKRFPTPTPLQT